MIETEWGIPIFDKQEVIDLLQGGFPSWKKVFGPYPLEEYLESDLTDRQKRMHQRFCPKLEVAGFENPSSGEVGDFYRQIKPDFVVVFSLFPGDIVAAIIEFKHGIEEVTLSLPVGVIDDGESPADAARREFAEEFGVSLEDVVSLQNGRGLAADARQGTWKAFSFLGIAPEYSADMSSNFNSDEDELIEPIFVPLRIWEELGREGWMVSGPSAGATLAAFRHLGYVRVP